MQADRQDIPQRPDSVRCNVSLNMIQDVACKVNDSLIPINALHLSYGYYVSSYHLVQQMSIAFGTGDGHPCH